jgi:hypothetical protein
MLNISLYKLEYDNSIIVNFTNYSHIVNFNENFDIILSDVINAILKYRYDNSISDNIICKETITLALHKALIGKRLYIRAEYSVKNKTFNLYFNNLKFYINWREDLQKTSLDAVHVISKYITTHNLNKKNVDISIKGDIVELLYPFIDFIKNFYYDKWED